MKIKSKAGVIGSDYVNASFVKVRSVEFAAPGSWFTLKTSGILA